MIDPRLASIPEAVLELVPESLARELCVLPFRSDGTRFWLFCPLDPDFAAREGGRLRYILNRPIEWVPVDASRLRQAIHDRYLPWHEATITNCPPPFRLQCPRNWSALELTVDTRVRHCSECQNEVHWCENDVVAQRLGCQGKRVALANRQYVES
jgi:hypothetical protein